MSFFENFTEKAKMYANMAAEKANDVAEVAADKAKDVKETAQLTMAIKSEQRELDKNYRAIGQWFASEYEGEIPDAIKDVMAAIEASRAKIEEMEAALAEKPGADDGDAETPELKVCPVCGTATNSKYCSLLYRRFIFFKISVLPDCNGKCKCVQIFLLFDITSINSSDKSDFATSPKSVSSAL